MDFCSKSNLHAGRFAFPAFPDPAGEPGPLRTIEVSHASRLIEIVLRADQIKIRSAFVLSFAWFREQRAVAEGTGLHADGRVAVGHTDQGAVGEPSRREARADH